MKGFGPVGYGMTDPFKFERPVNWAKRGFVIGWSSLCIAGMLLFMTALILLLPLAFVFSRMFE
jgi:hypothetical protein